MTDKLPDPKEAVYLPQLCDRHARAVVTRLNIGPEGPWQMALLAVQMACFRAATFDEKITARTGGDIAVMTAVLEEIGCLACWNGRAFNLAVDIAKKDGDWKPLFEAAFGKKTHPLWPAEWTMPGAEAP